MTPITNPTALADQLTAAVRDADRANQAMHEAGRITLTYQADTTPWLSSQFARLTAAMQNGTARYCPHLAHGPRVTFAAAWAPGSLVCAQCAPALAPDAAEDSTCDKCRRRVALLHARTATFGPLIFAYGLCSGCDRSEPGGRQQARSRRRTARR